MQPVVFELLYFLVTQCCVYLMDSQQLAAQFAMVSKFVLIALPGFQIIIICKHGYEATLAVCMLEVIQNWMMGRPLPFATIPG